MKKATPIFLAGILFAVTFLGLVGISKITGLWVQEEGHKGRFESMEGGKPAGGFNQSQELEDETQAMTEHFANMKISEFCQIAEIDTECAMSKLGIDSSQLESTFDTLAKDKGTTLVKMVELIQTCLNGNGNQENSPEEAGDDL